MVEEPDRPPSPPLHLPHPVIPAETYDDSYFREACLGAEEWSQSGGAQAHGVYRGVLERGRLQSGEVVVDIGAGRGELVADAIALGARHAVGVEYSTAGVRLAKRTLDVRGTPPHAAVLLADARAIPLIGAMADLVTMIDVVEHLDPDELHRTFLEAFRVLRPGGRILIHTMPNKTIYEVTYRLQRRARPGRRRTWPSDPRNEYEHDMHVNEQTPAALRAAIERAGFTRPNVRLGEWIYTDFVPDEKAKRLYHRLAKIPLLRRFGVADIWAEARRP